jgi:hypothetical protein
MHIKVCRALFSERLFCVVRPTLVGNGRAKRDGEEGGSDLCPVEVQDFAEVRGGVNEWA